MPLDEQIAHNKCYNDHMDFSNHSKIYSLKTKQDPLDQ